METHTQLERPGDMGKTERERRLVLSLLTPSRLEAPAEFGGKTRTTAGGTSQLVILCRPGKGK